MPRPPSWPQPYRARWPQQSGLLPSVSVKSYASASCRTLAIVQAQRAASVARASPAPPRATYLGGPEHEGDGGAGGDEVRVHAHLQHSQAAFPVVLPERLVPLHVAVAAEDVVDEHVEPAVLALDPRDEIGNGSRILVIDHERR